MTLRIAIDAMGGDYAPYEIVKGAVLAAKEYKVAIELVGKTDKIEEELSKYDLKGVDYIITHADEVIEMGEAPSSAIRRKKDSSIVKAVDAVAQDTSQAVVAAGSTGAAMAASLFGLGRLPGISRPAIACTLPTMENPVVLIDAGANHSCDAEMLYQFGIMGKVFSENVIGCDNAKIGLLNIGEEAGKGNPLTKEAYALLSEKKSENFNFIGNIEGRELFAGASDVVVCDGFVGNVTLKVTEGVANMIMNMLKREFKSSIFAKIVALFALPIFKNIKKRSNYEEYGGALLLGVKGICVIAHGGSKAIAIKNAIRVAKEAVEKDINGKIASMYEMKQL